MTRGDKIAFGLIALLLVLVIVFRKDLASVLDRDDKDGERKEQKKDKKDKKEGRRAQAVLYTHRA